MIRPDVEEEYKFINSLKREKWRNCCNEKPEIEDLKKSNKKKLRKKMNISLFICKAPLSLAQSIGTVEYTDSISAGG